ncbi:MAG: hypothetical protein ACKO37_08265 [Vampirovibrionales bacterium]
MSTFRPSTSASQPSEPEEKPPSRGSHTPPEFSPQSQVAPSVLSPQGFWRILGDMVDLSRGCFHGKRHTPLKPKASPLGQPSKPRTKSKKNQASTTASEPLGVPHAPPSTLSEGLRHTRFKQQGLRRMPSSSSGTAKPSLRQQRMTGHRSASERSSGRLAVPIDAEGFPQDDPPASLAHYRMVQSFMAGFDAQKDLAEASGVYGMTWEETCMLLMIAPQEGHLVAKAQEYARYAPDALAALPLAGYHQESLEGIAIFYEAWRKGVVQGRFFKLAELFQQASTKASAMALWFKLSGHAECNSKPPIKPESVTNKGFENKHPSSQPSHTPAPSTSEPSQVSLGKYRPLPRLPQRVKVVPSSNTGGTLSDGVPCEEGLSLETSESDSHTSIQHHTEPSSIEALDRDIPQEANAKTWATLTAMWLRPGLAYWYEKASFGSDTREEGASSVRGDPHGLDPPVSLPVFDEDSLDPEGL